MKGLQAFVRTLCSETGYDSIPCFSLEDGGTEAKILFLLRDPGSSGASKTGMVDRGNPGPNAMHFREVNEDVGLDRTLTASWNAVPWPVGEHTFGSQLDAALPWLDELLEVLDKVHVVALLGNDVREATGQLYVNRPDLHVLHGPHPRLRNDASRERRRWLEATVRKAQRLAEDHEA